MTVSNSTTNSVVFFFCFLFFFVSDFKKYTITIINPRSQCLGKKTKNILHHYLFGDKIIQNCASKISQEV